MMVSIQTTNIGPNNISDHVTEEMLWQMLKLRKVVTDSSHIVGTSAGP